MKTAAVILGILAALIALAIGGYLRGKAIAWLEADAVISALKVEQAEERKARADAYGKALADTLEKFRAETAWGNQVSEAYDKEKARHEKEASTLRKKIHALSRNGTRTFTAGFVRLYNEAIGLSGDPLSKALCAFGAPYPAGTGGAAGAGLSEPFDGVSEADLLAHIAKYGKRCRDLEAQVKGWQTLEKGWQ